ncbi:MAG: M50 family metallopeptidase [Phycisphaerales bacterium]|nr:M50 family metallopeptidase [Phycisphaerales bacterium]
MSFHDRNYSRSGGRSGWDAPASRGDLGRRVLQWLNWSFAIGYVWGIRVRVHITFVILLVFRLLEQGDPVWTLRWSGLLFVSVLLHEFGHCLACRAVGGTANDILMWPLGGLAFCAPPQRPWPEFVTVIWGPLVNILLAVGSYVALWVWFGSAMPVSLHPFDPTVWSNYPSNPWAALVADAYVVNSALTLFNLTLVFYPFDGGRLVQIGLWKIVGYSKSMRFATVFGMVGAIVAAIFGMTTNDSLLVFIAIFGFVVCWQQARQLKDDDPYGLGLAPSYDVNSRGPAAERAGMLSRWRQARHQRAAMRRAAQKRRLHEQVDRILDKVHREGMASLTAREKEMLQRASQG